MKIKCKVKSTSEDKIVLIPQQKFDPIDICGENAILEVEGCADNLFPI